MHGFISESVSKITDGLGGTLQLLAALAATTLLFVPVTNTFSVAGKVIYLFLLLIRGDLLPLSFTCAGRDRCAQGVQRDAFRAAVVAGTAFLRYLRQVGLA